MIRMITSVAFWCCVHATALAQPTIVRFAQKYDSYRAQREMPRLHLIFNQEKFSPGDTVWFKIYFLKEDLTGIAGQQVIEINLVDSAGQSKLHSFYAANDGRGNGQLIIPQTFEPGLFLLTAHSTQMLNFPGYFFKKQVEIVSTRQIVEKHSPFVQARPEGGHLVQGLMTTIIVHTDRPQSSAQVVDGEGNELGTTTTDALGFGSISFLPAGNNTYFVNMKGAMPVALPGIEEDGCSLRFIASADTRSAKLQVAVPENSAYRKELILMVTAGGKVRHAATLGLSGKRSEVELSFEKFSAGINQISILSPEGKLLASRDFFKPAADTVDVKIEANKSYFQVREKASLQVALTDHAGKAVSGEFSVRVVNQSLLDESSRSLAQELIVPSLASKRLKTDLKSEAGLRGIDLYLALNTEAEPWQKMLGNPVAELRFGYSGFLQKKGKATFSGSGKPVPEAQILFYLQQNNVRQESKIENGNVWLSLNNIYGEDQLLYYGETYYYVGGEKHGEEIPDLEIEWEDYHVDFPRAPMSSQTEKTDVYGDFTVKKRLIEKSFGFYTARNANNFAPAIAQSEFEEELEPDVTIKVQDYILFPTMAELIKEVIPSMFHRKSGKKEVVRVTLPDKLWAKVSGDPVYVIDGRVTKNTKFFLALKPADLLTVQIVNDQRKLERLGMIGKNGIVIVKTKNGDAIEPANPANRIQGLTQPLTFRTPDYSSGGNENRPDFRSTIYWNPTIATDARGKASVEFFCSDDIGTMSVQVDGLTTDGKPFTAITQMVVGGSNKP